MKITERANVASRIAGEASKSVPLRGEGSFFEEEAAMRGH
jgi:hypothetical protein